jgi:hypothetical protein
MPQQGAVEDHERFSAGYLDRLGQRPGNAREHLEWLVDVPEHRRGADPEPDREVKGSTCAGFPHPSRRLLRHARHRPHRAAMTDNARPYQWPLPAVVAQLSARQVFITPHCPGRTARSNDSTGPCTPSGPIDRSSPATTNAPPRLPPRLGLLHAER